MNSYFISHGVGISCHILYCFHVWKYLDFYRGMISVVVNGHFVPRSLYHFGHFILAFVVISYPYHRGKQWLAMTGTIKTNGLQTKQNG